ncbi:DUF3656 domain-containing U32 family peptidase [Dethiobacter alkaliphilus]|uniref:DUF3656 domain-containing U32 family peptidase n=1 Tax=Dethiobacter alkaliphilus TaxID=427926 RepID=UPI002225C3B4|nr:U32 family peptidase [Dethiobacter alkaliphilus]MCW3489512.1 U32 family peptidase [Dethiobacter alkaliphilus]
MKKNYEILAPAGSFEALQAAVQNGADAVYLSGKDFGARKFANNFTDEELREAIKYCHIRDVEVYVTVNTLVLNHEFERLCRYIDFLYIIGVDAVIVQDMGVLDYIRKKYSDLEIHCSTQMSVQTVEDIKYLESLGVSRVVLGREMTIEDIRRAKKETSVQLEVFVHGALCISVSGQCLMSSMIGGRSGNRGSCAQPCRLKYTLYNTAKKEKYESVKGNYLLSPKDLYTLDEIKTVIGAGAFSLKIEGRMKRPEYVATVVRAYRLMLEENKAVDVPALEKELKIFNRGFTKGHLFKESGSKLMSMFTPANQGYYLGKVVKYDQKRRKATLSLAADLNHNDEIQIRRKDETIGGRVEKLEHKGKVVKKCPKGQVCEVNFKHVCNAGEEVYKTYDEEFMKLSRQTYGGETLGIPVSIEITIKRGTNIVASLSDGKNSVTEETDIIPQEAIRRAITFEDVKNQLAKLGGSPYRQENIEVDLDEGLSVPLKEINAIRRSLIEKLDFKRSVKYSRKSKQPKADGRINRQKEAKKIELTYSAGNVSQLAKLIELDATIIYYKDLETLEAAVQTAKKRGFKGKIIPEIFRLTSDDDLIRYKSLLRKLELDTVLIQSYGHINAFAGLEMIADYNLNVVNDLAYNYYLDNNFARVSLSPELNLSQISAMNIEPDKTEILGYGYLPVMVMKHCVISTTLNKPKNCGLCLQDSYSIIDKMNESFKIKRRYQCGTEIHNSKKLMLLEYLRTLESEGVGYFRLNFVDETPDEIELVVDIHRKYISSKLTSQEHKLIDKLKKTGMTSGHLNRGIS